MLNGFNSIAPFYDQLAILFFGKAIQSSQKLFLNEIKDCSTILILGGGTGWFLKELLRVNGFGRIYYIEASSKMIELAKAAVKYDTRVIFIHGTEDNIPSLIKFDAITTNFYLDMFTTDSLNLMVQKIREVMLPKAYWIVTDFIDSGKWWQQMLLKGMYHFFIVISKIESSELPDWRIEIEKTGLNALKIKSFYGGFIVSSLFRLPY